MKPKKRQKLCHNCEGEIDIDVIVCPFCAADLREEKPEQAYSSYVSTRPMDQKSTMQSLYPSAISKEQDPEEKQESVTEELDKIQGQQKVGMFTPTVLFTLGVQLSLIGLLMLLFSHNGTVILKWDAKYWFFYILAALPFLAFGYRSISKL